MASVLLAVVKAVSTEEEAEAKADSALIDADYLFPFRVFRVFNLGAHGWKVVYVSPRVSVYVAKVGGRTQIKPHTAPLQPT